MGTQIRSRLYWIGRTLVIWISEVIGLALMAWLLSGIRVDSWGHAFLFIAVVGLLNALMWPILSRLTLRFIVYTFGFGALLFNAFVLWLGSQIVPGVSFRGLGVLILAALGITAVNTLFSFALSIDDEASYYRHALRRHIKKVRGTKPVRNYPGVVFLEIDGLSEPDLRVAIKEGYMPNIDRWLKSGSHSLMSWETDTSSQTGACQGAILHGNNNDMPAFRWVDKKDNNRLISCSNAGNVMEIEKHISDGKGLLSVNGYSRVNMFSGDAKDHILTVGRMTSLSKIYTPFYYIYFSNPYNVSRTIVLFILEIFREYGSRLRQKFKGVYPRFGGEKRGGLFPIKRATLCVYLRDIITYTLAGDIYLGDADSIYATYASHDELSHYCGPEDKDTMNGLTKLDKAFGRLERAAQDSERPYKFVILSDHGQTKGATFKQRYHMTLEEFVRSLLPSEITIHSRLDANEGWDRVSATLTDVTQNDERFTGKVTRRVTRKRLEAGQITVGPAYHRLKQERKGKIIPVDEAQVVVLASGNLGLIYLNDWSERMSYEQINQSFPNLINGLVNHEGVGFILVKSEKDGGIILSKNGKYYLNNDHVEGENPLTNFGRRAPHHLRRTDSFQNVPDIVVNSFYDPEKDEGAAFEEQIGFHGGMGGHQNKGLLLYPTEWKLNKEEIVGAEHLHRVLKSQLKDLQNKKR
jgi:putative membrane protein